MSENAPAKDELDTKAAALEAYNSVVEHAQLLDIRLTDFKFSVKPRYYEAIEEENAGEVSLTRTFDHDVTDIGFDPEIGALGGRFNWTLRVLRGKTKLVSVEGSFFVAYSDVPNVERQHAEAYLRKVGRFATYPYFRSVVAQMSWESSASLPVMPVLKK